MEFLNLVIIFYAGFLIFTKTEKEVLVKKLLIATVALFIFNSTLHIFSSVMPSIVL